MSSREVLMDDKGHIRLWESSVEPPPVMKGTRVLTPNEIKERDDIPSYIQSWYENRRD